MPRASESTSVAEWDPESESLVQFSLARQDLRPLALRLRRLALVWRRQCARIDGLPAWAFPFAIMVNATPSESIAGEPPTVPHATATVHMTPPSAGGAKLC